MVTRKVKSTGRFGARYGATVKSKFRKVESKKKQKQKCPFCKKYSSKRLSKGLWLCKACGKKFTSKAYYIQ